jgi:hypothetical protein
MLLVRRAAPVVLLLLFVLQSFTASRLKSVTFDEPAHIASGLSYLSRRVFHANLQHPPLIKELSAISLLLAGVRWPSSREADDIVARDVGPKEWGRDWTVGDQILDRNGADRVMFWARLPMIGVALLLGLAIYWLGRRLLGEGAALGALFLFAFDPNLIAHSYLVTTDVGLAAFSMIFLGALWHYVRNPSQKGQIWCGIALGCALGSKFTGVLLLPIAAVLLAAGAYERWRKNATALPKAAPNQPCPCGSGKKYKVCHGATAASFYIKALYPEAIAFGVMCLVALGVIEILYLFGNGPNLYLTGFHRVNADRDPNYQAYFAGEARKPFAWFLSAAYLLKEPIAGMLLAAAGVVVVLRRKAAGLTDKLFLLLPPAVFFAAYSFGADALGIRYAIPVMPFAWLAGGAALAWLFGPSAMWARGAAAILCVWTVSAAAGIYPDHLSYFNEAACLLDRPSDVGFDGGSRCGPYWLDDSNVDWGQGLKQLKSWLDRNTNGRPVHIMYFGTYPPEKYGIQYTEPPAVPTGRELYILSGHSVAMMSLSQAQIRDTKPIAIVGHAFYIYEF